MKKVLPKFQEENEYSSASSHQHTTSIDQEIDDFRHNYYFLRLPFIPLQPFPSLQKLLILLCSLLITLMSVFIKCIPLITCLQLLFFRSLFSLILLSLLTSFANINISQPLEQDRSNKRLIIVLSILFGIYHLLAIKSFQLLNISEAFALQSIGPLCSTLLSITESRTSQDKLKTHLLLGFVITGVIIMPSKENIVGVCVGCSSALVRTISAEIVKKSGCIVHPITLIVFGNFITTLGTLMLELIFHGIDIPTQLDITIIFVLSLCFFIASLLGIKAWEYQSIEKQQEIFNNKKIRKQQEGMKKYFEQLLQQMMDGINELGQGVQNFVQIVFGVAMDCLLFKDFENNIQVIITIVLISVSCLLLALRSKKQ